MYCLVSTKTISEGSYNTLVKIVAFGEEHGDLGWRETFFFGWLVVNLIFFLKLLFLLLGNEHLWKMQTVVKCIFLPEAFPGHIRYSQSAPPLALPRQLYWFLPLLKACVPGPETVAGSAPAGRGHWGGRSGAGGSKAALRGGWGGTRSFPGGSDTFEWPRLPLGSRGLAQSRLPPPSLPCQREGGRRRWGLVRRRDVGAIESGGRGQPRSKKASPPLTPPPGRKC